MPLTLSDLIPCAEKIDAGMLLDRFLSYTNSRGLQLYPAQENAILELFEDRNVILNTPTGSGKSLVAMAGHFKALAEGKRSVYTCPIKALVNEKWMTLCREFGPDLVGLSTGDATVNHDAPILCCTAEILANIALREGDKANVQEVIMDEFHFYADRDRGSAWQIPLLTMPQARFLLMSATLGDTSFFEEEITRLTGKPTISVTSTDRPVPLSFEYADTLLSATLERLVKEGKGPVYVVHFTQLEAAQNAQSFTSLDVCSREEKNALAESLSGFRFTSPYGPDIKRLLRQGIGIHHAGLLPKYRVLVEQLAQKGLLKVICGTDTLGVGINVPIRTVLFTRLCKYDGQKTAILSARDFHQISGRAGRKGFDNQGWVVAQAPEYVIENIQLEQKRAGGKKVTKRRPPDKNFVNWDKATFERLIIAKPERLVSRFQVSHAMLLNVLSRQTDGCTAMRRLIASSHDSAKQKLAHVSRAWQLFRSLVNRKIVEFIPRTPAGATVRVNIELQEDFSMDQALSLYLIETIPLLDAQAVDYPMRLLTLVESILEDPDAILRKQLDKIKTKKMAEMKMDGIPFEERIEELDKLEYPKPDREFVYTTFNEFSDRHPWVGQDNIRPKSIAREMFESFRSFADYVRDFELQRAEGLLLRHLNSVYDALTKSVPETAKTEAVFEMELYLDAMIRQVDSSLLDEWEKMRNPHFQADDKPEVRPPGADGAPDITRDTKAFTAAIRTRIFAFLRALSINEYEEALATFNTAVAPSENPSAPAIDGSTAAWTPERLQQALETYRTDHGEIRLDPEARNIRQTYVTPSKDGKTWAVQQMVVDPDDHNDWIVLVEVDCAASRAAQLPVLSLVRFEACG
jgi:superfamily II RNA helicase